MKLMYRIILFLIMLFSLTIGIASMSFNYFAKKSNDLIVTEVFNNKSNQIDVLLSTFYRDIELQLYDYTVWDDIYYNLNDKNSEWMRDNATFFLYDDETYNIDFIYLTNFDNDYMEFYSQDLKLDDFISTKHWVEFMKRQEPYTSIQLMNDKIYLLTTNKIYDNEMERSNGYYTMGYIIDEDLLNNYKGLLNFKSLKIDKVDSIRKYEFDKGNLILYYPLTKYANQHYGIIATYDITDVLLTNIIIFNRTLIIVLAIFLLSLILLITYLTKFTKDLEGISEKIKYINNGDYSVNLDYKNSKETIDISKQINLLAKTLSNKINDLESHELELIRLIIKAVEEKDYYTMGHSERVSIYSSFLAWKLGANINEQKLIRNASIVHDIGKIGIQDEILNKKTSLTDFEYDIIKMHPQKGYNILKEANMFTPLLEYVKYHHERYDGNGYPEGLKGSEIPLGSRILSVADTFDAITSTRPYRKALDFNTAIKIIEEERGKQFDPQIVDILIENKSELFNIYKTLNNHYLEKSCQ